MPKNVAWREGLFLRPQHFQQHSYTINSEMMHRTVMSGSNMWGLFSLEIDERLLGLGKLSLISASGVMPDGTIFDSRDFTERLTIDIDKEDGGKEIYLSLPLNYENEDNVYFEEQEELPTRYTAKIERNVLNTNAGEDSAADITFLYPNFKLMKEEEIPDGYTKITVAKIGSVSANGSVTLESGFSPTYLHLHRAEHIMSKLNELQGMLRYRAEKISEKISGISLQATELRDYLILQIINRTESRLHYYATQERLHPADLYLELSSLLGELAVFIKKERRFEEQFTYIHSEQGESFDALFLELKKLLSSVLESSSTLIPLDRHKYGIFIAMLKNRALLEDSSIVLAASANVEEERLKKLLMDNLKIGTVEEIKNLINHHLPGFKIVPLNTAPREIPYRVNQSYFRISLKESEREKLMRSSGFAMHFPEADELSLELYLWSVKNR